MATAYDFTESDGIFIGEDKQLEFEILDADAVPVDVTGWALGWTVRVHDASASALIEKSTATSPAGIAVSGVYDADPVVNTQRVVVTLLDTDTYDPLVSPVVSLKAGTYRHSLKRTDAGSETVLSYGDFTLLRATLP